MKRIYLLFTLILSLFSVVFTSCCKEDEPQVDGYNDYFIEVKFSGGGFSASELAE